MAWSRTCFAVPGNCPRGEGLFGREAQVVGLLQREKKPLIRRRERKRPLIGKRCHIHTTQFVKDAIHAL